MITLVVVTFLLGVGTTLAGVHSYTDLLKKHADARLSEDNKYLQEEVRRLRTQVALNIGKDHYPLYEFNAETRQIRKATT